MPLGLAAVVMIMILPTLAVAQSAAAGKGGPAYCPGDPTTCLMVQMADKKDCSDKKTGACWCSRMAYVRPAWAANSLE
jgi:hypothetical protein